MLRALFQDLELVVIGGDLGLEVGDNKGLLLEELILQVLCLVMRLTFLEVLDETDEVTDVKRDRLDLGGRFWEVDYERDCKDSGARVIGGCQWRFWGRGLCRRKRA